MAEPDGDAACWRRLDERLLAAVTVAQQRLGSPGSDPFRGLHLSGADVEADVAVPAGTPHLGVLQRDPPQPDGPLAWLAEEFALTPFDLDVVLICLAPEVDLRYERVYAYLQDDVRRRRPSVELILDLLCASAAEKAGRRDRFSPHAPLLGRRLLLLDAPDGRSDAPLLAYTGRLDPQIADVLLGQGGVDRRLADWCRLLEPDVPTDRPDDPGVDAELVERLAALLDAARDGGPPVRLLLHGRPGGGAGATVAALARAVEVPVLCADLARLPADLLSLVFREARLHDAVLFLDGVHHVQDDLAVWPELLGHLTARRDVTVLAGSRAWPPTGDVAAGVVTVPIVPPDAARRRASWAAALSAHGVLLDDADLDIVAARYRLDVTQIRDAAAATRATALLRGSHRPGADDVAAAARDRTGHELAELARRIRPRRGWDELVLPADTVAQLHEICDRARHRERVVTDWGFGRGGTDGLGTSVLFTGGSGTGKTTAAQIIAGELGLDLFTVDLSRVVSKYIGETEKNLGRIFDAARDADAVLFFDEADSLFGKRSEVRDSHDRYANIEVSFLLQRIEQFEGVAILATNLRQHLDDALLRRLAFTVPFPLPEEDSRRRIWDVVWPDVPRAECVDLDLLARRFPLTGGNIRNIALAASFLAAADGGVVRMQHLMHATRREYQKLGRNLSAADLAVTATAAG